MGFTTIFTMTKQSQISHTPDKLNNFTALFSEVKNKSEPATYFTVIFFARRLIFASGLVIFHEVSPGQIWVWVASTAIMLYYLITIQPFKDDILNKFSIFNEFCVGGCCLLLLVFDQVKSDTDISKQRTNNLHENAGWGMILIVVLCLCVNFIYLIPVKLYETFILGKNGVKRLRNVWRNESQSKVSKYIPSIQLINL